jgi:hypothetical protein
MARGQEKEVVSCEARGEGRGGGEGTRGDMATSHGKLEVNRRQTSKGLEDKDNNNKAPQTGREDIECQRHQTLAKIIEQDNEGTRGMKGSSYKKGERVHLSWECRQHVGNMSRRHVNVG